MTGSFHLGSSFGGILYFHRRVSIHPNVLVDIYHYTICILLTTLLILLFLVSYKMTCYRTNQGNIPRAPTGTQLSATTVGFFHNSLEDWDGNFQKHVWLMHSWIAHKGRNVQAIIRDRANTCIHKNIYHVATQLTLYRVFYKMKGTSKSWLDTVVGERVW